MQCQRYAPKLAPELTFSLCLGSPAGSDTTSCSGETPPFSPSFFHFFFASAASQVQLLFEGATMAKTWRVLRFVFVFHCTALFQWTLLVARARCNGLHFLWTMSYFWEKTAPGWALGWWWCAVSIKDNGEACAWCWRRWWRRWVAYCTLGYDFEQLKATTAGW